MTYIKNVLLSILGWVKISCWASTQISTQSPLDMLLSTTYL